MAPVLTTLRIAGLPVALHGYGLMLAVAVFGGSAWVLTAAARSNLDVAAVLAALAAALLGGFVGAHALFVLVAVVRGGALMDALGSGGIVFFGGALVGACVYGCTLSRLKLPVLQLLDSSVPAFAIAHALGRCGCFLGGCCYGSVWSGAGAVAYYDPLAPLPDGVLRHPVQLYEAGALFVLALASLLVVSRQGSRGVRLGMYCVAYGVVRLITEQFRGDADRGLFWSATVSTSELISVVTISGGLMWLFARQPARCKPSPWLSK